MADELPFSPGAPLPCRVDDSAAPHVLVAALGAVHSALRQGDFEPLTDRVVMADGRVLEHYYRDHLGITYYAPRDRTAFPQPPSGWCSWYYYGRSITRDEFLLNARWFAEHLKEYDLTLMLLDDGWQGHYRDWTGLRESFAPGMKDLAEQIRVLGLVPGLWLCPQGQDNETVVRAHDCFLLNPDGTSVTGYFGGPFTVDPTKPATAEYLRQLAARLTRDWGYRYLKTDGLPSLLEVYAAHQAQFADPAVGPAEAARRTFQAFHEGAGPDVFLAGCSGLPLAVAGIYHAQRTGADVDAEWRAFGNAIEATMRGYFLHQVVWFSDPDCCMLRPPLTLDMARAWASLLGLTGQLLLFSDRMPDLGAERVALIRRIAPPAPIRPFDLFPSAQHKRVFDLKVAQHGRAYDVVGVFNYDEREARGEWLRFADLGLAPDRRYHVYDFWAAETLGVYEAGVYLEVPPAACRVITLMPEQDFPVLLSTSRHVTQGWPDLEALTVNPQAGVISGRSRLIAGDDYALTFGLPLGGNRAFRLASATVEHEPAPVISQGRQEARVTWRPRASGVVAWEVQFTPTAVVHPLPEHSSYPYMLGVRDVDPWTLELYWVSFCSPGAFFVRQDGVLLGYVFGNRCRIGGLDYHSRHVFEIGVADLDGRCYARTGRLEVVVGAALRARLRLADLPWAAATSGYLFAKTDRSVSGACLTCAGQRHATGIGTHPASRIVYDLKGLFSRLTGAVGLEDQNGAPANLPPEQSGQAVFRILADGREVLAPVHRIYGQAPVPFAVELVGVQTLELLVEHPATGPAGCAPHADWLDLEVTLAPPPAGPPGI